MALIEQSEAIKALNQLHPGIPFLKVNIPKWKEKYAQYLECERAIKELHSVDAVPVVRCKDCKYFELNSWANVGGHPLIVAHEICKRWGDGCKTSPDGYCFMGERKDGKGEA